MIHHHHYYDQNDKAAILEHDHPAENVCYIEKAVPEGCPIYWDHEGTDCNDPYIKDSG